MSEVKKHPENITLVVVATLQAQSLLHTLDKIQANDTAPNPTIMGSYKGEQKRLYKQMIDFNLKFLQKLEINVNEFTQNLDVSESNYHADIVQKLDDFVEQITVEI